MRLQHWRVSQAEILSEAAPVLEFTSVLGVWLF